MKAYLNSLNEREKWLVILAILCLPIYFYYQFLYLPLSHNVSLKLSQLTEKTATLSWMKKVKQQAHASKTKQSVSNSQLLTLLATQLKDNSTLKFPYQLQQTGSGDIQLTFETVPFKLFMQWLVKLNEQYDISIKQFDAGFTDIPGVTQLMIILSATS